MENTGSFYNRLTLQALAIVEGESDLIANLSNISALLNMELENINWVGFYLLKNDELVLGPFQGKPACVRIPVGKGVCVRWVKDNRVMSVDVFHGSPGHAVRNAVS